MTDQFSFSYPSPLEGYKDRPPLPMDKNEDGKSYKNPQHGVLSTSYEMFPSPLDNGRRGGFDVHIYHYQNNPDQVAFAKELWERIRRECMDTIISIKAGHGTMRKPPLLAAWGEQRGPVPELRIYDFFDRPIGPHTVAMFEVNLFTPAQFGAFIPWLVINRGPLSALVHPNTVLDGEDERNHTQRATWLGEKIPLDLRLFKMMQRKVEEQEKKE